MSPLTRRSPGGKHVEGEAVVARELPRQELALDLDRHPQLLVELAQVVGDVGVVGPQHPGLVDDAAQHRGLRGQRAQHRRHDGGGASGR
jgi:hypothetical protein